jgi:L-threonylcarbamoyladenylate synthase
MARQTLAVNERFPMVRLLPTHTPALFDAAVSEAVARLQRGEVVVLPTETVYGLAANALDEAAVRRIFEIKGRPAHNPIIVHVVGLPMAQRCAATWPKVATRLAESFWPGPLTLVVEKAALIPDVVAAGGATVGLRWPSHPFIQAVIRGCDFPLAAPSANLSNQLSPTNAEHARKSLGERVSLIVDGGQSQVGIESTVVDVTQAPPRVLRPGMIHADALWAVVGDSDETAAGGKSEIFRSPGLMPRHYSPRGRLLVRAWLNTADLEAQLAGENIALRRCHVVAHSNIPWSEQLGSVRLIPHDAEAYARALYAELHRCDEEGAEVIVVEAVPDTPEWRGIADRLKRASS